LRLCWERGRPARTEREARKKVTREKILNISKEKPSRLRRGADGTSALPALTLTGPLAGSNYKEVEAQQHYV
jgi:hypothetical protein